MISATDLLMLLGRRVIVHLAGLMMSLDGRRLDFADVQCVALTATGSIIRIVVLLVLIRSRQCIASRYRSLFTATSDPTIRCR